MGGWIDEMSRVAQERENVNDRHMNESKKFYENNPREDNRKERVKVGMTNETKRYTTYSTPLVDPGTSMCSLSSPHSHRRLR